MPKEKGIINENNKEAVGAKCAGCGILVGVEFNHGGKKYCGDCFDRRERGIPPEGYDPRYFKPNETS